MKKIENLNYFYKGAFCGAVLLILSIALLYITYPFYANTTTTWGYLLNKGIGKSPIVSSKYYNTVAKQNKILLFGTSETGSLATKTKQHNYWGLVNSALPNHSLIVTGGAGNTPFMWMHTFCSLPPNTQVIYLVNPIYFTNGLNSVSKIQSYVGRYLSSPLLQKTMDCLHNVNKEGYSLMKTISENENLSDIYWKADIAFFIKEFFAFIHKQPYNITTPTQPLPPTGGFDTDYNEKFNVAEWILKERDFSTLHQTTIHKDFFNSPRYIELLGLVELAKKHDINLTLILMPPNHELYHAYGSSYPEDFLAISSEFKKRLCSSTIHCLDISQESQGLFLDAMHFSAYGARVVAKYLLDDIKQKRDNQ